MLLNVFCVFNCIEQLFYWPALKQLFEKPNLAENELKVHTFEVR